MGSRLQSLPSTWEYQYCCHGLSFPEHVDTLDNW